MLTIKELNSKVSGIRKSAKSLRDNIQIVLTHAAGHAYEHGDVTIFTKLYDATSGVNRKRMVKYIHDNCFAKLQKDGTFKVNKTARKDATFDSGDDVVAYLNTVSAWYVGEETASQILKDLDINQLAVVLAKKISDAEEKGQNVTDKDPQATAQIFDMLAERSRRAA